MKSGGETVIDAAGVTWRSGDIFETAALTALLTMMFVVALATVTILREPDETRPSALAEHPVEHGARDLACIDIRHGCRRSRSQ